MSRLIDVDDLPISYIDITDVGYYVSKYGQGIPVVYLEDIKDAPTIEPRKKGKWIENTFCSECGWIHEVEPGFIGSVNDFNYCPNCGAEMENSNGKSS